MYRLFAPWLIFLLLCSPSVQAAEGSIPDFALTDLSGQPQSLAAYRGKWVVVNFWATWCPPCLEELPELAMFHEFHHEKDAVVLGMNSEGLPPERLRRFVADFEVGYPIIQVEETLPGFGRISALPTTFLFDPEGRLVARKVGQVTMQGLEKVIAQRGPLSAKLEK